MIIKYLDKIYTFLVIHKESSFSKASRVLGISQPAVTQQIRILEKYLGVVLFERKKNGVILTKEGQAFLIYAKEVPKYVEKVTGINQDMLKNEATQKEILRKFRLFLGDSVFVAHAADFDYNFLAHQFEKENLGELLNRFLCTLTLSQKTI